MGLIQLAAVLGKIEDLLKYKNVIKAQFDSAKSFSEGLAAVKR